jgi:hypothetical protein
MKKPYQLTRYDDDWVIYLPESKIRSQVRQGALYAYPKVEATAQEDALPRARARQLSRVNPFVGISEQLSLRESCIREMCTCSLSGGRRPARKRASSDPTPVNQPNNEGQQPSAEAGEGRAQTEENIVQSHMRPTQSGKRMSQGLHGVRPAPRFAAIHPQ